MTDIGWGPGVAVSGVSVDVEGGLRRVEATWRILEVYIE